MKFFTTISTRILVIILLIFVASCSNSPIQPPIESNSDISKNLPEILVTDDLNRSAIAMYDAVIDPEAETFSVTLSRESSFHFPLTNLYPNSLQIIDYGFTPNFWADIRLQHPLSSSGIDAFDPRVIAVLPANPGVSFDYPLSGVKGNNSVVLSPDGYTKLFDNFAGSIEGNVNPFRAYFKNKPNRRWSSSIMENNEKLRWQMDLSGFGGPMQFVLIVDISTNYPNPPVPVTDNAPEPVALDSSIGQGLTDKGGSANVTITCLDWQGITNIPDVRIEAPDLFNGYLNLAYSSAGPEPDEYIFEGVITNAKLAPAGDYNYLVVATDIPTGLAIYKEFTATVEVTPPTGNLIWAKSAGGSNTDSGDAITTLSDDSIVVTGSFKSISTFGQGEPNETVLTSAGETDILVARYDSNGTLKWAKRAGGSDYDKGIGITALSADSVVVTGVYNKSAMFGEGEVNQTILTSTGESEIFIARYNHDGSLNWAKSAGGVDGPDYGFAVTALYDDSFVVTGMFGGVATFGKGEPHQTVLVATGWTNAFVAHYKSTGTLNWAKSIASLDWASGESIASITDDATIVSGYFTDITTFGYGEPNETVLTADGYEDMFIARYNSDGSLMWAKQAGGSLQSCYSFGVTALSNKSSVVVGTFGSSSGGTVTFGQGESNETDLTSPSSYDTFIAGFNPNGTLGWAKRAGGTIDSQGNGITSLSDNSLIVTGDFTSGTMKFGEGESGEIELTSTGYRNSYVARYNTDGTVVWAKRAGGSGFMSAVRSVAITVLSDDSTVSTGRFIYPIVFGPGEENETTLTSVGDYDIFIARFEP